MMDSFLPNPRADVVWRRLKSEDAPALHDLIIQVEGADNFLYRTSLPEVEEMLAPDRNWDCVGAFALEGEETGHLVCYGYTGILRSRKRECWCEGGVLPAYRNRNLGQDTLKWQTARARQLMQLTYPDEEGQIAYVVEASKLDVQEQLEHLGYQWRESSVEMRRSLAEIPEMPDLGPYIQIVEWSEEWSDLVRRALNQAARQGLAVTEQSAEEWSASHSKNFAPEWSFIALDRRSDRPQVLGFVQVGRYEQDWQALGWKEGYIDMAVVLRSSSQPVLTALLIHSMQAQATDGMACTGIGMDPDRDPITFELYQRIGFKPHSWSRVFAQPC